ncbi:MAG: flavodoxin family protein [Clostridia bacterium]|nr:flavodoxin family protein [Clostridia bacterium]
MKLFINASSRKHNSFKIIEDIKRAEDIVISLSDLDINFCLGCNVCIRTNKCCINDEMTNKVYDLLLKSDEIIIVNPIYMDNITGLLKNFLDRFNALSNINFLKNQKVYLILTGQQTEADNIEVINSINAYFEDIKEWMNFDYEYLCYFCGGDIIEVDSVENANNDYKKKIKNIKDKLYE